MDTNKQWEAPQQLESMNEGSRLLEGQVALITGASRGIGAATATLLARHGAAVAVNYVKNLEAAQLVVKKITGEGGKAVTVQADIGDIEQVQAMIEQVGQTLGPIDTLVLNAIAVKNFFLKPFTQFQWEDFEDMVVGELKAAFYPCQAAIPAMIERKHGNIIGISSGLSRNPMAGSSAHSTGKSGLDAFMKALAVELGPQGIRVNVVAPGLTETDATAPYRGQSGYNEGVARFTPLRRIGNPEDVAGAVLFLASPHARFVTGSYLPVSGGIQMI